MTDSEFRELDEAIDHAGFAYNVGTETWLTKATADSDAQPVEWHDVIAWLPYLSLNDLELYEDWARHAKKRRRADVIKRKATRR